MRFFSPLEVVGAAKSKEAPPSSSTASDLGYPSSSSSSHEQKLASKEQSDRDQKLKLRLEECRAKFEKKMQDDKRRDGKAAGSSVATGGSRGKRQVKDDKRAYPQFMVVKTTNMPTDSLQISGRKPRTGWHQRASFLNADDEGHAPSSTSSRRRSTTKGQVPTPRETPQKPHVQNAQGASSSAAKHCAIVGFYPEEMEDSLDARAMTWKPENASTPGGEDFQREAASSRSVENMPLSSEEEVLRLSLPGNQPETDRVLHPGGVGGVSDNRGEDGISNGHSGGVSMRPAPSLSPRQGVALKSALASSSHYRGGGGGATSLQREDSTAMKSTTMSPSVSFTTHRLMESKTSKRVYDFRDFLEQKPRKSDHRLSHKNNITFYSNGDVEPENSEASSRSSALGLDHDNQRQVTMDMNSVPETHRSKSVVMKDVMLPKITLDLTEKAPGSPRRARENKTVHHDNTHPSNGIAEEELEHAQTTDNQDHPDNKSSSSQNEAAASAAQSDVSSVKQAPYKHQQAPKGAKSLEIKMNKFFDSFPVSPRRHTVHAPVRKESLEVCCFTMTSPGQSVVGKTHEPISARTSRIGTPI